MGCDYALVHLYYTIPPAIVLTLLYRPLFTRLDVYKILFLISVAVTATIPWDSYLIHNRIWTYPPNAVLGPTLFDIPAEELFFFVIQTYITSLLYLIISKPTFGPAFLRGETSKARSSWRPWRWVGQAVLVAIIIVGAKMVAQRGEGLYLGLILVWAVPVLLFLWTIAYQFIIGLPLSNTVLPIALPTVYLWIIDTMALNRGTWAIESGTKLGWNLWDGLDIEEAVFFLVTNMLIVFGQLAFDNALAIAQAFPKVFPMVSFLPSPYLLTQALLLPLSNYDESRLQGMRESVARLQKKSRSFYLASGVFPGRLRIDLVLLYSFCRVADDLIDNATSAAEAGHWIALLTQYLDYAYGSQRLPNCDSLAEFVRATFPPSAHAALILLPTSYLSPTPFYDLLKGFETDLEFSNAADPFPIKDEASLHLYASRVAGTVAESCIELVYHHTDVAISKDEREKIVHAGGRMGIALQLVNIARDIKVDALINRVYLPTSWLKETGMSPEDVVKDPETLQIEKLRQRLIDHAMDIYGDAKGAIDLLPTAGRGPMRVAVESYIEIGRTLRKPNYKVKAGRATVPKWRRLMVAWNALSQ